MVRFRRTSDVPLAARAIVIAMPGFLGGAGSLEGIARSVVRAGVDSEPAEVWAIDRRSNALEDLAGMDAAEVAEDAEIAREYYFGNDTVGGRPFAGYVSGNAVGCLARIHI